MSKSKITAEVVKHSVSAETGQEVVTVKVRYALIVHSEFLRHRQLSRCVKSNRAIPASVIRSEVLKDPYIPVFFGKNKSGMQANESVKCEWLVKKVYLAARYPAVAAHWLLEKMGLHKQTVNRILNPWQWVEETITATCWKNTFALRIHEAAQADVRAVVEKIEEAIKASTPTKLCPGEWHVPYVDTYRDTKGVFHYVDSDGTKLTKEQAVVCSTSRCARSSYNKHDKTKTTYQNDLKLYNTLVADNPKHMSPAEHPCTPINQAFINLTGHYENGITHISTNRDAMCSGNFVDWIQHRHLIENESVKG